MHEEIEAKIPDIDVAQIRERLTAIGAQRVQPMRLMRRALVETEQMRADDAFLRLRDEDDRVTLTYKQLRRDGEAHVANECEIIVDDFVTAKALVEMIGFQFHTYQETRRETWDVGGVEVVIDEWPWLEPYIEVEGKSEQMVRSCVEKLGLSWDDAVFGNIDILYERSYDFAEGVRGVIDVAEARFDSPLPAVFTPKGS